MRLILFLLLLLPCIAYGQAGSPAYGGVAYRVLDTATYQTAAATRHSQGYADIYYNAQATVPHFDVWNGSSYTHVFDFNAGGGGGGSQDFQDVLDNGASANIGDSQADLTAQDGSNYSQWNITPSGAEIGSSNNANTASSSVGVNNSGIQISDTRANRGIQGAANYSANIQSNDYTQKVYVDAAVAAAGTVTSITTTGPIIGGTITTTGNISIQNAAADGSTKGAAAFTAADFDAAGGLVSIDYTNAQKATNSVPGFMSAADHAGLVKGAQDLFVSSVAMWSRVTNGCASLAQTEMSASLFNVQSLDFDQTTQEFAQMQFVFPRNWDNGTITATVYWTAASGSGGVVWGISGGAYSNDDAMTVALGTAQTVSDTFITANDLHITSTSSAITLAGTPADADFIALQISRNPADGSDTLNADAKLLGVRIVFTLDAGTSE